MFIHYVCDRSLLSSVNALAAHNAVFNYNILGRQATLHVVDPLRQRVLALAPRPDPTLRASCVRSKVVRCTPYHNMCTLTLFACRAVNILKFRRKRPYANFDYAQRATSPKRACYATVLTPRPHFHSHSHSGTTLCAENVHVRTHERTHRNVRPQCRGSPFVCVR